MHFESTKSAANLGSARNLIAALGIEKGIVSFVGAGGKKSTMWRIAESYLGRVAITATAHIERFPRRYRDSSVLADGEALHAGVRALRHARVVAFAQSCDMPGRHAGVASDELLSLYKEGEFDLCLVKADGARGRVIKAPAEHEPPLSQHSSLVIGVVSARAIGMPLTENLAHRPERVAAVTGAQVGESLQPLHIAKLLVSDNGLLKNTDAMPFVALINMVDDAEREQLAHEAAAEALKMTTRFDRVVLASMKRDEPLVAIVHR